MISNEAVEAAARAMAPHAWDQNWMPFMANGDTLESARLRAQESARITARAAIEAAAPHMLADAWDEGSVAGWVESGLPHSWNAENSLRNANPHRTTQ